MTPSQIEAASAELEAMHSTVEAELTANERQVDKLTAALHDAVSTNTETARQRDAALHRITELEAQVERLTVEYNTHSCGPTCERPLCVANRRVRELEGALRGLIEATDSLAWAENNGMADDAIEAATAALKEQPHG